MLQAGSSQRGCAAQSPPHKGAASWTRESSSVNPEQDPTPQQAETGRKELRAALASSGAVPAWGNSPAARKNEDASHLQDLKAQGSVSNHLLAAPALKASPGSPPLQSQMVPLSPTEHVGTQDPTGCSPIPQSIGQVWKSLWLWGANIKIPGKMSCTGDLTLLHAGIHMDPHVFCAFPWKQGDLKQHGKEEGWRELHGEGETEWCQALQGHTESPYSWAQSPGDRDTHG